MSVRSTSVNTIAEGVENEAFSSGSKREKNTNKLENFVPFGIQMAEEVLLPSGNDGRDSRIHQKVSNFAHPEILSQPGLELKFQHIDFSIKEKKILNDISGTAQPGKVLAVMGPSGSGKTTLLNILGGRVDCPCCNATIGGQPLTKETRRKISYVLQQDIFFPNLTLQQTLEFAAELRLSEALSTEYKRETVKRLIEQLDMTKCTNTIIGDNMIRGLSGGEKKRANIANELLTDPAVLLLDEPTSGLDSSTAYALTLSLKKYAVQNQKTVMMTIHQPSVQMFFQFDNVLLLSGGRIAYYGSPEDVLKKFGEMGFSCDFTHYNPADFILDVVKSGSTESERLIAASDKRRLHSLECPIRMKKLSNDEISIDKIETVSETKSLRLSMQNSEPVSNGHLITEKYSSRDPELAGGDNVKVQLSKPNSDSFSSQVSRWPTSYIHQTKVLTIRSFIQGKHRYLSKLNFIKVIGVAIIMGLAWFQVGRGNITESQVYDIVSALFFLLIFNAFNSLFDVLVVFPSEREVVNKERMSGSYRLSAYYFSKSLSELPLCLVLPTISLTIFYWMAGLNGFNNVWAFFGTWFVMIGTTLASQSLGLFISAATMDFDHALVLAIFIMISFMLLGGFYVKNFPSWLYWMRYISPFMYAWSLMIYLEFDSDTRVLCNEFNSAFPSCSVDVNSTYVPHQEIFSFYGADTTVWICCIAILVTLVFFRICGYFLLRLFHKPITK